MNPREERLTVRDAVEAGAPNGTATIYRVCHPTGRECWLATLDLSSGFLREAGHKQTFPSDYHLEPVSGQADATEGEP